MEVVFFASNCDHLCPLVLQHSYVATHCFLLTNALGLDRLEHQIFIRKSPRSYATETRKKHFGVTGITRMGDPWVTPCASSIGYDNYIA